MVTSQGFWINPRAFRVERLWAMVTFLVSTATLFVIQTFLTRKLMAFKRSRHESVASWTQLAETSVERSSHSSERRESGDRPPS